MTRLEIREPYCIVKYPIAFHVRIKNTQADEPVLREDHHNQIRFPSLVFLSIKSDIFVLVVFAVT